MSPPLTFGGWRRGQALRATWAEGALSRGQVLPGGEPSLATAVGAALAADC